MHMTSQWVVSASVGTVCFLLEGPQAYEIKGKVRLTPDTHEHDLQLENISSWPQTHENEREKNSFQTWKQLLADFPLRGEAVSWPTSCRIICMANKLENFWNWCDLNSGQVFQSPKQLASFYQGSRAYGAVMRGSQCSQGLCFSQREHISLNSLAEIGPPDGISASLPILD